PAEGDQQEDSERGKHDCAVPALIFASKAECQESEADGNHDGAFATEDGTVGNERVDTGGNTEHEADVGDVTADNIAERGVGVTLEGGEAANDDLGRGRAE